jgi:glycosyltransferase involved in cell wall biosynthesis
MKIIFRISYMGFGGAERVFLSLAKQFKTDHDVTFVTDSSSGDTYTILAENDIKVINLESKRTLFSIFKFRKIIDELNPDVILSAYPDTNAAAIISTALSKVNPKVLVTEHASIVEHFKNRSALTRFKIKFIIKNLYPYADKVVAVSEGVMNDLLPLVNVMDKCCYIHNPVRFESKQPILRKDIINNTTKINIIAVGRVTPQKDYTTLIKAVNILLNDGIDIQLNIVGGVHDQKEMDNLKGLVSSLDIGKNIFFLGFRCDIDCLYQSSDLFVLSSAWEGFGNVIVEAMSFGLPIISTNCRSGPSEILEYGKYGRLVEVGDYEGLAENIKLELKTPSSTVKQRILRAADFSEMKIAEKYLSLF